MDEENLEDLKRLVSLLSDRQALDLLLVVTGSRPACLIMDPENEAKQELVEFCDSCSLYYKMEEERSQGLGKEGFFVAVEEKRLEELENSEGRFYGLSDRHVGNFLGFPDEDIAYFHENVREGPVEQETREKKAELLSNGEISDRQAEISEIVSYVPKPSAKCIKRASRRGMSYLEDVKNFDSENDTEVGSQVLEDFLGRPVNFSESE